MQSKKTLMHRIITCELRSGPSGLRRSAYASLLYVDAACIPDREDEKNASLFFDFRRIVRCKIRGGEERISVLRVSNLEEMRHG
jgi:hypothetical protein